VRWRRVVAGSGGASSVTGARPRGLGADLLDRFVDKTLANRELFLPAPSQPERALRDRRNERHRAEQDHIEERIRGVLTSTDIALDDRVRMAWTLGGILMPLLVEDAVFGGDDIDDIAAHVRALARETLMIETRTP
jgi:hypothetical protein